MDITNLDTSKLKSTDNIDYFRHEVIVSSKNVFTVVHNALSGNPNLSKVCVVEHAPRFDDPGVDPTGLKPILAKFANSTFNQLWMESPFKSRIIVAAHNIFCNGNSEEDLFTDDKSGKYDGVHMFSSSGKRAFTKKSLNHPQTGYSCPCYENNQHPSQEK